MKRRSKSRMIAQSTPHTPTQSSRMGSISLDRLAMLGPWDLEIGWKPTQEMVDRAAGNRPFWAEWDKELQESIEQLYRAFRLRSVGFDFLTFDPTRVRNHASDTLSQEDQEIYERFMAWLCEMHDAKQRPYISDVRNIIVLEGKCLDQRRFKHAVMLHCRVRARGLKRRPTQQIPRTVFDKMRS